jgi:hypothetical protein
MHARRGIATREVKQSIGKPSKDFQSLHEKLHNVWCTWAVEELALSCDCRIQLNFYIITLAIS